MKVRPEAAPREFCGHSLCMLPIEIVGELRTELGKTYAVKKGNVLTGATISTIRESIQELALTRSPSLSRLERPVPGTRVLPSLYMYRSPVDRMREPSLVAP